MPLLNNTTEEILGLGHSSYTTFGTEPVLAIFLININRLSLYFNTNANYCKFHNTQVFDSLVDKQVTSVKHHIVSDT